MRSKEVVRVFGGGGAGFEDVQAHVDESEVDRAVGGEEILRSTSQVCWTLLRTPLTKPFAYRDMRTSRPRVSLMRVRMTASRAPEEQMRCCGRKRVRGGNEAMMEMAMRQRDRRVTCGAQLVRLCIVFERDETYRERALVGDLRGVDDLSNVAQLRRKHQHQLSLLQ